MKSRRFREGALRRAKRPRRLRGGGLGGRNGRAAVADGAHAAGFLAYEAGAAFEPQAGAHDTCPTPLLWFGLFDRFEPIDPAAPEIVATRDLKVWFPIKRGLLRRTVGHVKAVDGATLSVRAGETLGIVDRAYILHDGVVLKSGSTEEIVADPQVREVYLGDSFSMG